MVPLYPPHYILHLWEIDQRCDRSYSIYMTMFYTYLLCMYRMMKSELDVIYADNMTYLVGIDIYEMSRDRRSLCSNLHHCYSLSFLYTYISDVVSSSHMWSKISSNMEMSCILYRWSIMSHYWSNDHTCKSVQNRRIHRPLSNPSGFIVGNIDMYVLFTNHLIFGSPSTSWYSWHKYWA